MKKVLFFFPQNPYPPRNGSHRRCLQLLSGLKDLGCDVVMSSSAYTTNQPWTKDAIEGLINNYGCSVSIHIPSFLDKLFCLIVDLMSFKTNNSKLKVNSVIKYSLRNWFTEISKTYKPDIVYITFAHFDSIISDDVVAKYKVIEMHDLSILNSEMQSILSSYISFKDIESGDINEITLCLDYYDDISLYADKEEYAIYDKYKYVTCISDYERKIVDQNTSKVKSVFLPVTFSPVECSNTYKSDALFCLGPNLFNVQGYFLFLLKVLPVVLKSRPDFRLRVTGHFYGDCIPFTSAEVFFDGFITDLKPVYENARFFVCPVFAGTGQQIKIVEAMAHGLAVVAFRNAADRSPLIHGVNGFIADNIIEFADYVLRLWSEPELCRKMGGEARTTITEQFSDELLVKLLAEILE